MKGRSRRWLAMATATIAIVGLVFVVAVASSSRPGEGDEPWLDVSYEVVNTDAISELLRRRPAPAK